MGIILLVASVFLVIAVLMQSGKSHNLSGSIAGGAETFFGKTKGKAIDKMLSKVTTIVAIAFTLLVIIMYVIQPNIESIDSESWFKDNANLSEEVETTTAEETTTVETYVQVPADQAPELEDAETPAE
jgi:protein translocase, SecG subunit